MALPQSENLDQALVRALLNLKKASITFDFSAERIDFIINHPYESNYAHLARRIIEILLEYPQLRTLPEGNSIRRVLFNCLKKVNATEFQIALCELKNFYLSSSQDNNNKKNSA